MAWSARGWRWAGLLLALSMVLATGPVRAQASPGKAGLLRVSFLFMPPTSVEPTYHTAIWLEDAKGAFVRTLYVSTELSNGEYKLGNICPDWARQAKWEKVAKAEIDAVTAATPNVGTANMAFDLAALGLAPGVYQFKLQVHITEQQNVLHYGTFTAGAANADVKLDVAVGPGKVITTDQFVKEVQVQYSAAAATFVVTERERPAKEDR